jgi:hypothetical protein
MNFVLLFIFQLLISGSFFQRRRPCLKMTCTFVKTKFTFCFIKKEDISLAIMITFYVFSITHKKMKILIEKPLCVPYSLLLYYLLVPCLLPARVREGFFFEKDFSKI